jgi:hypothetical protein
MMQQNIYLNLGRLENRRLELIGGNNKSQSAYITSKLQTQVFSQDFAIYDIENTNDLWIPFMKETAAIFKKPLDVSEKSFQYLQVTSKYEYTVDLHGIWSLCHLLFFSSSENTTFVENFLEWINTVLPISNMHDSLLVHVAPSQDENYWPFILHCLLRGILYCL